MKINKQSSYFFLTGVLFLFPVLSLGLRNFSIFIWAAFALYCIIKNKEERQTSRSLQEKTLTGLLIMLFLLLLISILYTENFKTGFFGLEKRLALFIFPLLTYLSPYRFSRKTTDFFLNIFIASNLAFLLFSAGTFLIKYNPSFKWENIEIATVHFRHLISTVITGVHPTYQAAWFFYSALLCFYFILFRKEIGPKRFLYTVPYIIFISWGVFLAARTPFVGFLVATFILALSSNLSKIVKITFLLMLVFGAVFLTFLPSIGSRVNEALTTSIAPPKGDNYNSVNIRVGILSCAATVIKDNWLFGVGLGDVQDKLDICYQKYETEAYSNLHYNTHNQYLHSWLSAGIFGFFCLLSILITALSKAIKHKNVPLLAFTTLISICFLTENLLARNDGVLFFSIIISVLGIGAKKDSYYL